MLLIIILVMPALATLKCVTQGKVARGKVESLSDVLLFNSYVFFISGILSLALFVRSIPPVGVLLYAAVSAAMITVFQVSYTVAFKTGPVSKTSVINSFSIAISMIVGVLFLGDRLTVISTIGLVLMAFSFVLIPSDKGGEMNRKWLLATVIAFLASGSNCAVMNVFAKNAELVQFKNAFVAASYLLGGILCLILHFVFRKGRECVLYGDGLLISSAVICGLCIGIYNLLSMLTLAGMSSLVFYPVVSVSGIIMLSVVNCIVFKEKLSTVSILGIVLGTVAIVLVNF